MEHVAAGAPGTDRTPGTLHLHIGLPKTASTWLQDMVFPQLDHLEVRVLPKTRLFHADLDLDHNAFRCAFRRATSVWAERGDAVFEERLGPRSTRRPRDLLLSDDGIGRLGSRPELLAAHLTRLAQTAADWGFARLHVICLVRRQDRWLASHDAQMSNRRANASQADFEREVAGKIDPAGERYGFGMLIDYASLHSEIVSAAARPDLTVLPLEALAADPGSFLQTLLASLDVPPATADAIHRRTATARVNVRSSGECWHLQPRPIPGMRRLTVPLWSNSKRRSGIRLGPESRPDPAGLRGQQPDAPWVLSGGSGGSRRRMSRAESPGVPVPMRTPGVAPQGAAEASGRRACP